MSDKTKTQCGGTLMVTVYHNGQPVKMWPVDARFALSLPGGEYSTTDTNPVAKHEATTEQTASLAGLVTDPDEVTVGQLRDALRQADVVFRGNASKADLITQWNAFVTSKD